MIGAEEQDQKGEGRTKRETCLVTGASGVIGGAIARELLLRGERVALGCFKNEKRAKELAAGFPGQALVLPFDAREEESCLAAVRRAEKELGQITALIHAAGQAELSLIQETSAARWRELFALHVDAAFYLVRAVLPPMLSEKRGSLLLISSIWGQAGASMEAAYSAAKAAQIGLMRALAKELGPSNIRVNALSPGLIESPMNDGLDLSAFIDDIPLSRPGLPSEVAKAAAFLCSEEASYISGQVLGVNGGLL
ncbi:MAG: SDR family oxidoreductase [Christensenellaceae bacterium]|jgi:3-oxoacyl-[acyl-carrier protein] reductase|nr:SDR family oxidoreductase [Christensenellaceae bacterium]